MTGRPIEQRWKPQKCRVGTCGHEEVPTLEDDADTPADVLT